MEKEITEKDIKTTLLVTVLVVLLVLLSAYASAQTVVRQSNDFKVEKTVKSNIQQTQFTYTISDKSYPVFINKESGRCFINKISSKTGKEYKYYLPETVCREICKELNIEYKEKDTNVDKKSL